MRGERHTSDGGRGGEVEEGKGGRQEGSRIADEQGEDTRDNLIGRGICACCHAVGAAPPAAVWRRAQAIGANAGGTACGEQPTLWRHRERR